MLLALPTFLRQSVAAEIGSRYVKQYLHPEMVKHEPFRFNSVLLNLATTLVLSLLMESTLEFAWMSLRVVVQHTPP